MRPTAFQLCPSLGLTSNSNLVEFRIASGIELPFGHGKCDSGAKGRQGQDK
jgi:hypothetical protein